MAPRKYPKVRERNGSYTYRYDTKDPTTGKRKQGETTKFATPKEAYLAGIKIEEEIRNGIFIQEKDTLFVDWCDKWLELYAATGKVKQRTVDIRRETLTITRKAFAGLKLREITKLKYQSFLDGLKNKGYSKSSVQLQHSVCRMLFQKGVQLELIRNSPADDAEMPAFRQTVEQLETEEALPKYLEKEELALLLNTAKESGDSQGYHVLFTLAYTGMRIGELCALKVTDIDQINKNISVTKTLFNRNGIPNFKLSTPKTKSSIRKIDISNAVITILKNQESWRNAYKMSERKTYQEKQFIFVNAFNYPGYPASCERFQKFMKRMLELAKLPTTLTPHSLRHTYTSLMAEAGVELPTIQRLLGHQNDGITQGIYLHVTKPKRREAAEKLDDLMSGLL